MPAPKDPVWLYFTSTATPRRVKCTFCSAEMFQNPTFMKDHILKNTCKAPADVRDAMARRLHDGKRGNKEARLSSAMEAADCVKSPAEPSFKRAKVGGTASSEQGGLSNYVSRITQKENAAIDSKCARWIYQGALPLQTTESRAFLSFTRALNPAYKPPSRFSLAGPLLDNEFLALKKIVDAFVQRCVAVGNIVVGGDGWSDLSKNSIYNVVVFTPDPLYVETEVWGESRHTAENTAAFYAARIDALGARNVCAFVSDTEPKMRALWDLLQDRYPWMLMLPCAAHAFNLLFGDICKNAFVSRSLEFCNNMHLFCRNQGFPKATLERCQVAEYGRVIQLQRPGDTRWKSQYTAAESLLKTQCAMEKAVVDAVFKRECINGGSAEQRRSVAKAVLAVKNETNWEELRTVAQLLKPLAVALDNGQSDGIGIGRVRDAFFQLQAHFINFAYPQTSERMLLKQHVLKSLTERRTYSLRPIHNLAYMLDPRFVGRTDQLTNNEVRDAFELLKSMAAAHDVKLALEIHRCSQEEDLPADYDKTHAENVMAEYTAFKAKDGGLLSLPLAWKGATMANPMRWWRTWGESVPCLQVLAVKIMQLPAGFAAGERSFSNAGNIKSKLRTRLSYATFHKLLFIYFNSRALPTLPPGYETSSARTTGAVESPSFEQDGVDTDAEVGEGSMNLHSAANHMAGVATELLGEGLDSQGGGDEEMDGDLGASGLLGTQQSTS